MADGTRIESGRAMRSVYLTLAAVGFVVPYAIILPWFHSHGLDLRSLVALPFSSGPAAMFSMDVLLSAIVFLIWADAEGRRLGMGRRWRPLAAVLVAGLCFALPLFLARREAAIALRTRL